MLNEKEFFAQLTKIREFQINDLKKADEIAKANFLVCVGCFNATEVLGGIRKGLLGSNSRGDSINRFRAGIDLLGQPYKASLRDLWELRSSMIHTYLGQRKPGDNLRIGSDSETNAAKYPRPLQTVRDVHGNDIFIVNVSAWRRDLDKSWDKLVAELSNDARSLNKAMKAFDSLPTIL